MNCKTCQSALPDFLLASPGLASEMTAEGYAKVREHLAICSACAEELASLQATASLLEAWEVPDVSPYFDQRLAVRLREEIAAPSAGWFERLKDRILLNTGRQFRPAIAAAFAVVLIVGGGSLGISSLPSAQPVQASATVNDLQILDKNEQALQQMDQLLQDDSSMDDSTPETPPS